MKDELLDSLQKKHPLKQLEPVKNPFNYLVKSIVYQQLSTKAASTIYDRLKSKYHYWRFVNAYC